MNRQTRIARRIRCAALAAALGLLGGAALAADGAAPERRAVTVGGHGQVSAVPDRARLSMSIELTRPELKAAQAEANRIVRDYLAQVRALGARDEDISTAALSIRAEYTYSDKLPGGRKFLGYHVSRGIEVVVRDLDRIGDFLARATDAGINSVNDPVLESSRAEELRRQALARAAADAKANASVLAEALGARLGAAHTINAAVETAPPRPRIVMAARAPGLEQASDQDMGFAGGSLAFDASVTVDFDLQAP
ncbi:MAG: SIMPL domain-containing protein [Nevskia sp.]|nr:SIMPL domain-containing protein [Nevskia sp.]